MIEVIEKLKQLKGPNFTDVCQKQTFECYRMLGDGCMQSVTLVIFDAGPNAKEGPRYLGHATSAEGRTVVSVSDSSLDVVLGSMRWSDLDPEPDPAKQAEFATAPLSVTEGPAEPAASEKRDEFDRRDLFGMLRKRLAGKP